MVEDGCPWFINNRFEVVVGISEGKRKRVGGGSVRDVRLVARGEFSNSVTSA
jgi:hypothetical protein